jgi:ATP-dependent DNA helicase RecG
MTDHISSPYEINLQTEITYLKGVGPVRAEALQDIEISTVGDLLYHFPRRYLDRRTIKRISELHVKDSAVVMGKVKSFGVKSAKRRKFFEMVIEDDSGEIKCVWFQGISWISDKFNVGESIAIFGKVEFYNGFKMVHPEFDLLDDADQVNTGKIIPLYASTSRLKSVGLDSRGFRKIIMSAFELLNMNIPDYFSTSIRNEDGLIPLHQAMMNIHEPRDEQELKKAIFRLKYDEHFFLQLLMALRRQSIKVKHGTPFASIGPYTKKIYDSLDFQLTNAQINVLKEIRQDLAQSSPMNRLIQGDVGSGKTIVAMLSASIVIGGEGQVAVMAPTEILAEQHYISFKEWCDKVQITCALLTGSKTKKSRAPIYDGLEKGKIQLLVGTHALIQEDVKFQNLGLIIIDEQHRFGVEHRKQLIQKGLNPHVLAMTATPIPRTLAFTIHGDMDISIIDELPKSRIPIITKVVEPPRLQKVYDFLKKEMDAGRQCFIVYPLIEESEKMDLKAAESGYENLKDSIFKDYTLGYIHGRMKNEERDKQMEAMAKGEIQCLVATTVIEVGINIPNATVMIIENAERFGLTQLHQLRGRIGRGEHQGYCVLVKHKHTKDANHRLKVMESTSNGFKISDEDLKLRGPGEFFGTRQHGYIKSKIANFVEDGPIIRLARSRAVQVVHDDPQLNDVNNRGVRLQFLNNYQHMLEYINIS